MALYTEITNNLSFLRLLHRKISSSKLLCVINQKLNSILSTYTWTLFREESYNNYYFHCSGIKET
jgi:hypothetical protein